MLGKLIKHEWKAVAKILIIIHIALLGMAVLGRLLLNVKIVKDEEIIWLLMFLVYGFSVFSVSVVCHIYLAVRFYKNMYTDEGYLTFTLPVKPWEHIFAKLVIAAIWYVIDILTIILSIFILVINKEMLSEAGPAWKEFVVTIQTGEVIGTVGVVLAIGVGVLSMVSVPLTYYFCISLGQLFKNHKLIASVIIYFVVSNVIQAVSTMLNWGYVIVVDGPGGIQNMYTNMMLIAFILQLVMCALFWGVTQYIMSRRLNLE